MFVVYDPSAGFVTGVGWIMSLADADQEHIEATGKANFGFVSKYKKGATTPIGQTDFRFKAGGLNFHSSTYEWVVVAGARAQYKGMGTINGEGNYGFMLTAIDGQVNGGGGVDKFRIKIWNRDTDALRYDNQAGSDGDESPSTSLGGGQIKIHNGGKQQVLAGNSVNGAATYPSELDFDGSGATDLLDLQLLRQNLLQSLPEQLPSSVLATLAPITTRPPIRFAAAESNAIERRNAADRVFASLALDDELSLSFDDLE